MIRALPNDLLVSMSDLYRAEGGIAGHAHQIDPATGLLLGRDVDVPVGRIIGVGANARRWLSIGQTVLLEADRGAHEWQGMQIQRLRVVCPDCGRLHAARPVLALLEQNSASDAPGRTLGAVSTLKGRGLAPSTEIALKPHPSESHSVLVYADGAGVRFSHAGVRYVSLRTADGCGGHSWQEMEGTQARARKDARGFRPHRGDVLAVRELTDSERGRLC
jgi:hypothetical protein